MIVLTTFLSITKKLNMSSLVLCQMLVDVMYSVGPEDCASQHESVIEKSCLFDIELKPQLLRKGKGLLAGKTLVMPSFQVEKCIVIFRHYSIFVISHRDHNDLHCATERRGTA